MPLGTSPAMHLFPVLNLHEQKNLSLSPAKHSAFSESFRREIYSGSQKAVNISVVVMVTAFQIF